MKFAPICPIPLMQAYGHSDYHMALAHLMPLTGYADFFKFRSGYKILDNSVIEMDEAIDAIDLIDLAKQHQFDEVIIPDVPMKQVATLKKMKTFFDHFSFGDVPVRLMGVPQGETLEAWFQCLHTMMENFPLDTIGIPKNLDKLGIGTRIQVCHMLDEDRYGGHEYHLLGIFNNPLEIASLAKFDWIRGCDSVLPIWLGQHGVRLHPARGLLIDRPKTEVDFLEARDPFPYDITWNLQMMRRWCNGADYRTEGTEGEV